MDEPVDDEAMAQGLRYARGLATEQPDYPGASRFVPAAIWPDATAEALVVELYESWLEPQQ